MYAAATHLVSQLLILPVEPHIVLVQAQVAWDAGQSFLDVVHVVQDNTELEKKVSYIYTVRMNSLLHS